RPGTPKAHRLAPQLAPRPCLDARRAGRGHSAARARRDRRRRRRRTARPRSRDAALPLAPELPARGRDVDAPHHVEREPGDGALDTLPGEPPPTTLERGRRPPG